MKNKEEHLRKFRFAVIWTPEWNEALRKHYAKTPMAELLEMFPGKNVKSIRNQASILGVKRDTSTTRPRQPRQRAPAQPKEGSKQYGYIAADERLVIPIEQRRVCNGTSTQPYVCTELSYRGRA